MSPPGSYPYPPGTYGAPSRTTSTTTTTSSSPKKTPTATKPSNETPSANDPKSRSKKDSATKKSSKRQVSNVNSRIERLIQAQAQTQSDQPPPTPKSQEPAQPKRGPRWKTKSSSPAPPSPPAPSSTLKTPKSILNTPMVPPKKAIVIKSSRPRRPPSPSSAPAHEADPAARVSSEPRSTTNPIEPPPAPCPEYEPEPEPFKAAVPTRTGSGRAPGLPPPPLIPRNPPPPPQASPTKVTQRKSKVTSLYATPAPAKPSAKKTASSRKGSLKGQASTKVVEEGRPSHLENAEEGYWDGWRWVSSQVPAPQPALPERSEDGGGGGGVGEENAPREGDGADAVAEGSLNDRAGRPSSRPRCAAEDSNIPYRLSGNDHPTGDDTSRHNLLQTDAVTTSRGSGREGQRATSQSHNERLVTSGQPTRLPSRPLPQIAVHAASSQHVPTNAYRPNDDTSHQEEEEAVMPTSAQRPNLTPDSDDESGDEPEPIRRSETRRSNSRKQNYDVVPSDASDIEPSLKVASPRTSARGPIRVSPAKKYGSPKKKFPAAAATKTASQIQSRKDARIAQASLSRFINPDATSVHVPRAPSRADKLDRDASEHDYDPVNDIQRERTVAPPSPSPPRRPSPPHYVEHIEYRGELEDWRKRRIRTTTAQRKTASEKRKKQRQKQRSYVYPSEVRAESAPRHAENAEEEDWEDEEPIRAPGRGRGRSGVVRKYIDDEAEETENDEEADMIAAIKRGIGPALSRKANAPKSHDGGGGKPIENGVWGTEDDPLAYLGANADQVPEEERRVYREDQQFGNENTPFDLSQSTDATRSRASHPKIDKIKEADRRERARAKEKGHHYRPYLVDKQMYRIDPRHGDQRLTFRAPSDQGILVDSCDGGEENAIKPPRRPAPAQHPQRPPRRDRNGATQEREQWYTHRGEYVERDIPQRGGWRPLNEQSDLFSCIVPTVHPRQVRGSLKLTKRSSAAPRLDEYVASARVRHNMSPRHSHRLNKVVDPVLRAKNIPTWKVPPIKTITYAELAEHQREEGPIPAVIVTEELLQAGKKSLRESYNSPSKTRRPSFKSTGARDAGGPAPRGGLQMRESLHDRMENIPQRIAQINSAARAVHPRVGQLRFTNATPPLSERGTPGRSARAPLAIQAVNTSHDEIIAIDNEGHVEVPFPASQAFQPRDTTAAEHLPVPKSKPSMVALKEAEKWLDQAKGNRKEREDSIDLDAMLHDGLVTHAELSKLASDPALFGSQAIKPADDEIVMEDISPEKMKGLKRALDEAIEMEEAQDGTRESATKRAKALPAQANKTPVRKAMQSGMQMTDTLLEKHKTWRAQGLELLKTAAQPPSGSDAVEVDDGKSGRSKKSAERIQQKRDRLKNNGLQRAQIGLKTPKAGQTKLKFKPIIPDPPANSQPLTDPDAPGQKGDEEDDIPVPMQTFGPSSDFNALRVHLANIGSSQRSQSEPAQDFGVPFQLVTRQDEDQVATGTRSSLTRPRPPPPSASKGLKRKMSAADADRAGLIPSAGQLQRQNDERSQRALSSPYKPPTYAKTQLQTPYPTQRQAMPIAGQRMPTQTPTQHRASRRISDVPSESGTHINTLTAPARLSDSEEEGYSDIEGFQYTLPDEAGGVVEGEEGSEDGDDESESSDDSNDPSPEKTKRLPAHTPEPPQPSDRMSSMQLEKIVPTVHPEEDSDDDEKQVEEVGLPTAGQRLRSAKSTSGNKGKGKSRGNVKRAASGKDNAR